MQCTIDHGNSTRDLITPVDLTYLYHGDPTNLLSRVTGGSYLMVTPIYDNDWGDK